MTFLIIGLILFLGLHSSRVFAPQARQNFINQRGEGAWKGLYSVVSLVGFGLIIYGYSLARQTPTFIWQPPVALKHVATLLILVAFILLTAAYVPKNAIKAKLGHPMVLGTKVWALSHLLVSGKLANMVLFGSFLIWAVLCFRAARARDRLNPPKPVQSTALNTAVTIVVGIGLWLAFALWGHALLIGVRPFG